MTISPLNGLSILVVEDEPLIALDFEAGLERAGAIVAISTSVKRALEIAARGGLSGAILDHAVSDGESQKLYADLRERGIPFLIYSGFPSGAGMPDNVPHVENKSSW